MNFKNWLLKANMIKEHCQPFLKKTDDPLYRGVSIPLGSSCIPDYIKFIRSIGA